MDTGDPGKLTDHVTLGTLTRTVPRFIVDEVLTETESREKRSDLLTFPWVISGREVRD
jgi:hypothetical protein